MDEQQEIIELLSDTTIASTGDISTEDLENELDDILSAEDNHPTDKTPTAASIPQKPASASTPQKPASTLGNRSPQSVPQNRAGREGVAVEMSELTEMIGAISVGRDTPESEDGKLPETMHAYTCV